MFTAGGRRQLPQGNEEPAVDLREIDKVLSEIAGMLGRWSTFKKFLLESLSVCGLLYSSLTYVAKHVNEGIPRTWHS